MPPALKPGDRVRFVSPASPPDRDAVLKRAALLESWGLQVDFGRHAFDRQGFLAGSDAQRLSDLNAALSDPAVRAVFATRGGKGSYRIADRLDIDAVRADPKFLVGFSDITILHLSLWQNCRLAGIHGALLDGESGDIATAGAGSLKGLLMEIGPACIRSDAANPTVALTTHGTAEGPLVGGNLDMIATAAGWALPDLHGAILLLEAAGMHPGQIDRALTMLRRAGHLAGLAGVAVGQVTATTPDRQGIITTLVGEHLSALGLPVLGGLPVGHGRDAVCILHGVPVRLDTAGRTLTILRPSA